MEPSYKEVYFHHYCKLCKHWEVPPCDQPCDECLSEPNNLYSHKPVKYEEDPEKVKKDPFFYFKESDESTEEDKND